MQLKLDFDRQNNQRKAGALLSYLGIALNVLIQLGYTPVMLRLLGQSEYGIYNLAYSTVGYLGLLDFGFSSAYVRYFSKYAIEKNEKEIARLNGMFLQIFVVIGLIALAAGAVLVSQAERMYAGSLTMEETRKIKIITAILVVNLSLGFPASLFDSCLIAHDRFVAQKGIYLLKTVLNPFLALPLLLSGFASIGIAAVTAFLTTAAMILSILYCAKHLRIRFDFHHFDKALFQDIFVFCFFIFLNQVVNRLNWSADQIVLGVLCGSASVAVYAVASNLNNIYMLFSTSLSNVFIPQVNRMVANRCDKSEITDLFIKVGRLQFLVMALIASGLVFFGRGFIYFYAGEGYESSYAITLLLALPAFIPMIQNLGIEIQRSMNQHKFRSLVYLVIALCNVVVSIPLALRWGAVGAAFGTSLSMLLGNGLIMNLYYQKALQIDVIRFWKEMFRLSRGLVLPFAAGILFMHSAQTRSFAALAAEIVTYTLVYFLSMWRFGMNSYEKGLIRSVKRHCLPGTD